MMSTEASQVLAGIKSLISNPPEDKATRLELYESLKELSAVVEDPHDTICRVVYSVSQGKVRQSSLLTRGTAYELDMECSSQRPWYFRTSDEERQATVRRRYCKDSEL